MEEDVATVDPMRTAFEEADEVQAFFFLFASALSDYVYRRSIDIITF
jgi:hypothetical protein